MKKRGEELIFKKITVTTKKMRQRENKQQDDKIKLQKNLVQEYSVHFHL
jgi:hypothetical protein